MDLIEKLRLAAKTGIVLGFITTFGGMSYKDLISPVVIPKTVERLDQIDYELIAPMRHISLGSLSKAGGLEGYSRELQAKREKILNDPEFQREKENYEEELRETNKIEKSIVQVGVTATVLSGIGLFLGLPFYNHRRKKKLAKYSTS